MWDQYGPPLQDRKEMKCNLIKLVNIFPNSVIKHVTEFKTASTYQLTWQEPDTFIRILHVFAYMDSNNNMYTNKKHGLAFNLTSGIRTCPVFILM